MRRDAALVVLALLLVLGLARATVLPSELARVLDRLPAERRHGLQGQARSWAAWTPAQRSAFTGRAAQWDALDMDERRRRREAWQAWRLLPAAQQARLAAAAREVAAMDAPARQALQAGFDGLDATTRRGWLLGPVLGADYPRLQPLLAQVPAGEGAGLLRVLHAMTPQERADLAVLVQRTPPQGRDELRRALVSTSADNRAAWLQLRLER